MSVGDLGRVKWWSRNENVQVQSLEYAERSVERGTEQLTRVEVEFEVLPGRSRCLIHSRELMYKNNGDMNKKDRE